MNGTMRLTGRLAATLALAPLLGTMLAQEADASKKKAKHPVSIKERVQNQRELEEHQLQLREGVDAGAADQGGRGSSPAC